jgi:Nif-specific regulatory protein
MITRSTQDRRSHVELITVYEISRILSASLDIDRNFRVALNVLSAHIELPRVMIVLADRDSRLLKVHSSVGMSREESERGVWQLARLREGQLPAPRRRRPRHPVHRKIR